jgi:hypothetical protein
MVVSKKSAATSLTAAGVASILDAFRNDRGTDCSECAYIQLIWLWWSSIS